MVGRHARSLMAPDAYVFPGTTVRADDSDVPGLNPVELSQALSERSDTAVEPAQAARCVSCLKRPGCCWRAIRMAGWSPSTNRT
jgi:hypothetical protein